MKNVKFPHFHQNDTFYPKVHFGPFGLPKPLKNAVLRSYFHPWPKKCAFRKKSHFSLISALFAKINFFMIFMIFMKKT